MSELSFGRLVARNRSSGAEEFLELAEFRDFYIGRASPPHCQFTIPEKTISNLHLRIYVTGNTADVHDGVYPLVYVQNFSRNGAFLSRYRDHADCGRSYSPVRLRQGDQPLVLHHKDRLDIGSTWYFTYILDQTLSSLIAIRASDEQRSREMREFEHLYAVSRRKIGGGDHSQVFLAFDKFQDRQLACKIVDKGLDGQIPLETKSSNGHQMSRTRSQTDGNSHVGQQEHFNAQSSTSNGLLSIRTKAAVKLISEVDILQHICHPNIIRLKHVFVSETATYMFQDLVTGGDLLSYIELRGGNLCEAETANIIRQILEAVKYLHENRIIHRDLKPENILMTSLSQRARIMLADFSSAKFFGEKTNNRESQTTLSQFGTLEYAAPEIRDALNSSRCDSAADLWSIGVITTTILTGINPILSFEENNSSFPSISIRTKDLHELLETEVDWQHVSRRAKSFVSKLLVHEADRMTAMQALKDGWLTNSAYSKELDELYNCAVANWNGNSRSTQFPIQILRGAQAEIPILNSPSYNNLTGRRMGLLEKANVSGLPAALT